MTEKAEDEVEDGVVSEGLEGAGNRIPTTDPGKKKKILNCHYSYRDLPSMLFFLNGWTLRN
jgi:hypothetical protein